MAKRRGLIALVVVVGVIVLIVAVPTVSDVAYANELQVSAQVTPRVLPADGQSAATITLRYRDRDGKPRAGDILTLLDLSQNAGTIARHGASSTNGFSVIAIYRIVTDSQGRAIFRYIAAASNPFVKTAPAHIEVTDTSLGTILEIDKTTMLTVNVVDPRTLQHSSSGAHS